MLGGLAVLNESGVMIAIDRPLFRDTAWFIGKTFWQNTRDQEARRQSQQAFCWAMTYGEQLTTLIHSGGLLPTSQFQVRFERISASPRIVLMRFRPYVPDTLSDAERRIADSIATDEKPREFCKRHGISPKTYDVHRTHIFRKLGIHGPAALALWHAELKRWV